MIFLPISALTVDWSTELDKILDQPKLSGAVISAQVTSADGKVLYARNPNLRVMPASNQKLLSVSFALATLGPEFKPTTRIWKLADRIVVDCPGDPWLSEAQLLKARADLNVSQPTPVFVRQGFRPGFGPGWEWDDLKNRYAPTISAFTVARGGFEVFAGPNGVEIEPSQSGVKIRRIDATTMSWHYDETLRILTFRGPLPASRRRLEAFALPDPDSTAAKILASSPAYPTFEIPNRNPDVVIEGPTVRELAKLCLVPSDNYLAESLMFMAANKTSQGKATTFEAAAKEMIAFHTKTVGVGETQFDPYDGSGLSRHNNVTASGLTTLLHWAKKQPTWQAWIDGMAVPGSGTLSGRLAGSTFRGKTGTLNKVVSLSGYVRLSGGEEITVSIVINHFLGGNAIARDAADQFVKRIESLAPSGPILAVNPNREVSFAYSRNWHPDADRIR